MEGEEEEEEVEAVEEGEALLVAVAEVVVAVMTASPLSWVVVVGEEAEAEDYLAW